MKSLIVTLVLILLPTAAWSYSSEGGTRGFGIMGGYDFANNFNFTTGGLSASYNSTGAAYAGLTYAMIPKEGIGFQIDALYEFNRVINSASVLGMTINSTGSPGMSIILPEANIAFGLQMLYLFAGANYSIPSSTGTWGTGVSLGGTIGYQAGLGAWLGEHLTLEALYRSIAININNGSSGTYNTTLAGFGANLAFTF